MKESHHREDERDSISLKEIESASSAMIVDGKDFPEEKANSSASLASASPSQSRTALVSGVCTPASEKTLHRHQPCNDEEKNEADDLSSKRYPAYGEFLILYGSHECVLPVILRRGGVLNTRLGNYRHEDIISTPYGSKVYDRKTRKWLVPFHPTPSLFSLALTHRTQILYHADISATLSLLDIGPGKKICEAGTGSGSLSFHLAQAVEATGHVFTFEFHLQRKLQAELDFERLGVSSIITCFHRDVCAHGFVFRRQRLCNDKDGVGSSSDSSDHTLSREHGEDTKEPNGREAEKAKKMMEINGSCGGSGCTNAGESEGKAVTEGTGENGCENFEKEGERSGEKRHMKEEQEGKEERRKADGEKERNEETYDTDEKLPCPGSIDGVFLDVPSPWLAIDHVDAALKENGRFVNFSPCVEQVQRVCEVLHARKYRDVRTFEIFRKPWGVWTTKPTLRVPFFQKPFLPENKKESDSSFSPNRKKKHCRSEDLATEGGERTKTQMKSLSTSDNGESVSTVGEQPQGCLSQHSHLEGGGSEKGAVELQSAPGRASRKGKNDNRLGGRAAESRTERSDNSKNTDSKASDTSGNLATFPVLLSHLLRQPLPQEHASQLCSSFTKITGAAVGQRDAENECSVPEHKSDHRSKQQEEKRGVKNGSLRSSELSNGMKRPRSIGEGDSDKQDAPPWHQLREPFLDFESTHYPLPMRGHTGYLTVAIKPRISDQLSHM